MTLNIGQLIEDAERIRQNLVDKQLSVQRNSGDESALRFTRDILAMSNIIDYLKERYVPPSEPGSYKDARGIIEWKEGDEPAEDSIRRIRGG